MQFYGLTRLNFENYVYFTLFLDDSKKNVSEKQICRPLLELTWQDCALQRVQLLMLQHIPDLVTCFSLDLGTESLIWL